MSRYDCEKSDIWSIGCIHFQLRTCLPLLDTHVLKAHIDDFTEAAGPCRRPLRACVRACVRVVLLWSTGRGWFCSFAEDRMIASPAHPCALFFLSVCCVA